MARSLQIPQYVTGTIAIGALSGGSYPVTGVGTNFLSPDGVTNWTVAVGDILVCGNAMGLVGAINSATSLSLVFWSGGVVSAGASYAINRLTGLPTQAAAGLVQQLLAAVAVAAITSGSINGATIGLTTAAAAAFTTLSLAGHAVSDANYSVAAGISVVAYAAITAARTLTLPAASGYAAYQQLLVVDVSGACSASNTITLARAGSDTINGGTSAVVAVPYGYVALASNGSNAWTIVDSNAPFSGDSGSGGAIGLVPAPPAHAAAYNEVLGAGGSWVGQMAGFRNRIINGACAIDQRNAGASQTITAGAALAYTIDRFYGYCTGANVTGQRVAGSAPDQYLYQFTGAASVTAIGFAQRIETANSFDLAGTTATLSVKLANSLLTTVAWTAYYANSTDTFGTLASPTKTQIATGTWTVNSTLTKYSAQIAIPSAATTGVEIVLSVGAQTSGTWQIGEAQLEAGQAATPFERRPIGVELGLCQRYFSFVPTWAGVWGSTTSFQPGGQFYTAMKVAPTATFISGGSAALLPNVAFYNVSAVSSTAFNASGGYMGLTTSASTSGATGFWMSQNGSISLSAEM
jgi:hypothetical protein